MDLQEEKLRIVREKTEAEDLLPHITTFRCEPDSINLSPYLMGTFDAPSLSAEEINEGGVQANARLGELQAAFVRHGIMADSKVVVGRGDPCILGIRRPIPHSPQVRGGEKCYHQPYWQYIIPVARNAKKTA